MFKNLYFRLGLITAIATTAILMALPRIPINIHKWGINLNSYIGGYYLSFFDGRYTLDLTELKKGLDLEGGVKIVLQAKMDSIAEEDRDSAIVSAREVIARRVDFLGVAEASINTSKIGDSYRINVEIPGIDNISEAISIIGKTAQLNFKILNEDVEWSEERFQELIFDSTQWSDSGLTGADLRGVDVVFQNQGYGGSQGLSNSPSIQLRFTNEGREKFSKLAQTQIGKPIALYLDEDALPISAPIVNESLADDLYSDPIISGNFNLEEAQALSLQIRAGALPVPVEIVEQQNIGATLGDESINTSFFAGIVGLIIIMVYMVFAYGRLGFIANIALAIYAFLVLAIFKIVPVVLTLPGIAGFILSIGMASDANILIFERIKEEISWGKPRGLAIKFGFERAWTSIKDSNISSLLTAFVLFYFGTGPVRGFALTLAIGILVSLFTSIFVTHTLIRLFDSGLRGSEVEVIKTSSRRNRLRRRSLK
ncbi:MAG: protein translocase subunit SecD [Patescibacteria group bacterium]